MVATLLRIIVSVVLLSFLAARLVILSRPDILMSGIAIFIVATILREARDERGGDESDYDDGTHELFVSLLCLHRLGRSSLGWPLRTPVISTESASSAVR